jgi:hypothetical protein
MGTNLEVFADFAEWSMVDVFKLSSPWFSGSSADSPQGWVWDDGRTLDLDPQGWIRSLEPDQLARSTILWGPLPIRPEGRYVVLYDGEGTLGYSAGAQLVSSSPGRDVIEVSSSSGIELDVLSTNPDDYIRNIRVIMPGGIYADDPYTIVYEPEPERDDYLSFEEHYESILFHPDFLDSIRPYDVVRYMNWMYANVSTQQTWDDRPLVDDARWTLEGVPVEILVELANRVGFDPWFTFPHLVDDAYVTSFATFVHDNLDPALTPIIEYSNEVWNTQFDQYTYASDLGLELGLDTDPYQAMLGYLSQRSAEIFRLWEDVAGNRDRFTTVISTKSSAPEDTQRILDLPDAAALTDLVAMGAYFGIETTWDTSCDSTAAMTIDQFLVYLEEISLPSLYDQIRSHLPITEPYEIPLAVYEGGQHLTTNPCGGDLTKQRQVEALYDQANRDPRMRDIYLTHLSDAVNAGITLFAHYNNTAKWTPDGRFGAREHLLQTRDEAPKYDAILTFIEQLARTG